MTDSPTPKPVVLIVDDSKVIRLAARKMLGSDYKTIEACDGAEAWQHIQDNDAISVVFTDLQMPEMDGLELLAHVRASDDERVAALPVIMITGQEDSEAAKKRVFDKGATDFVSKPFESIDLISRAKSYATLNRQVNELEKKVGRDKLTGLYNTTSFEEHGSKILSFAQRHKTQMSVAVMEIENFQQLFLSTGKAVAQQIMMAVCKRMSSSLRAEDVAARVGVARIALLLPSTSINDTRDVVARMMATIAKLAFDTGKEKLRVELACGISAVKHREGETFSGLYRQAESLLATAVQSTDEKIVLPVAEADKMEMAVELSEEQAMQAFRLVLQGSYTQIPAEHLPTLVDRLRAFMQYVENENASQKTA